MASSSEDVEAPRSTVPLLVEPILLEVEGGRYVGQLLPDTVAELVIGRHGGGGVSGIIYGGGGGSISGSGGGGN